MAVSSRGPLRRSHSQGRKARRSSDRAADQVRTGGQSENREGAGAHHTAAVSHARGPGDRMNVRRKFLVALVGSALAAPRAPLAQPPGRARRIGFLWESDTIPSLVDAFRAGLRELGYVEGKDYVIEQRSAKRDLLLLKPLAAELLALKVDLIVAPSNQSAIAARGTS